MDPILVRIGLALFTILCFSPMLVIHARRRKGLRKIRLEAPNDQQTADLQTWKKAVKSNADLSDAAAYCFAFTWAFGGILFAAAALVLAVMAARKTDQAKSLGKKLMFPKGFKWITSKVKPSVPDSAVVPHDITNSTRSITPPTAGVPSGADRSQIVMVSTLPKEFHETQPRVPSHLNPTDSPHPDMYALERNFKRAERKEGMRNLILAALAILLIKTLITPSTHTLFPDVADSGPREGSVVGFRYVKKTWWGFRKQTFDQIRFAAEKRPQYFDPDENK